MDKWVLTLIAFGTLTAFSIYAIFVNPGVFIVLLSLLCIIITIVSFRAIVFENDIYQISMNKYTQDVANFPKLLEEYEQKLSIYEDDVKQNDLQYEKDKKFYEQILCLHNEKCRRIDEEHKELYSLLSQKLEQIYDENIIFPKYRNLIAITAINEYLVSGRCDKLEGPDGAYNLYEMELRQNIIIGQLSSIMSDLEQIKSNQFSLYQELQKSNETINTILYEARNLKEETKLISYFSEVTAMAECSPKYYIGMTV